MKHIFPRFGADFPLREQAGLLYLLFALPSLFLLLLVFPNYHAPDDPDHFKRAYTLLHRPLDIVTPPGRMSGAKIDSGLLRYSEEQFEIAVRPDRDNTTAAGKNPTDTVRWRHVEEFSEMPGAISYLPLLYAPQALAIEIGRSLDLTIKDTVLLARIVNGIAALLLTWLALVLLLQGHALVLALLFMPRTMLQYASNSPDPLLFALTLLVIALGLRQNLHRSAAALVMSIAIFGAAALRPPLAALAVLIGGLGLLQRRPSWLLLPTGAVAAAAAWVLWAMSRIVDTRCTGEAVTLFGKATTFAINLPALLIDSFAQHGTFYLFGIMAHYGYGEGPSGFLASLMPPPIYPVGLLLLAWAIRIDLAEGKSLPRSTRALLALTALGMVVITFFAMYVVCTAGGTNVIAGVQGRYFIPALFALAPAVAGTLGSKHVWPWRQFALGMGLWVGTCLALMLLAAPGLYRL